MKLTKLVHSCVLVEDEGKAVLFDPGIFSWNSGIIDVGTLPVLDCIVVTHRHPDHMGEPFIKELIRKQPDVQWVAPADAHDDLRKWGAQNISDSDIEGLEVVSGDHAPVEPFGVQVGNVQAHWLGKVTTPGDSHELVKTCDVLLLPVQAPWGTTIRAIELAEQLKPKYVLPTHDWMWNEQWRQMSYDRFEHIFPDKGITFLRPDDGKPIEI